MELSLNTGAGRRNTLTGRNSSILTGCSNTVSANYGTVLGGQNSNVLAGHNFSAVFGNGINSTASNTFHVDCLSAIGTPPAAGQPPGTYAFKTFATLGPLDKVIVML